MNSLKKIENPLYLHFLDRELRRAENAHYSDSLVLKIIQAALLRSLNYCYSSASLLLESQRLFPESINLLIELEKLGNVRLLASEHSYDEFILTRQKIYSGRISRYPMYFKKKSLKIWPTKPIQINSTTYEMRKNILGWLIDESMDNSFPKNNFQSSTLKTYKKIITNTDTGVTLDLLHTEKQLLNDKIRRNAGRLISYFYTDRYLNLYGGDILCGLPDLSYYDILSKFPLVNNYQIIIKLMDHFQIFQVFQKEKSFNIYKFISFVSNKLFRQINIEFNSILYAIAELSISLSNDLNKALIAFIHSSSIVKPKFEKNIENNISIILGELNSSVLQVSSRNTDFEEAYYSAKKHLSSNKRVLIVTATSAEATLLLNNLGNKAKHTEIDKIVYWNLGVVNNSELYMIKSSMGSVGSSGSILSINVAIKNLSPNYVVMTGICFGLNEEKQSIGQILISNRVADYETAKIINNESIARGNIVPPSSSLLNRFINSSLQYSKNSIEDGLMLSGDKLVDSKPFIDKLKKQFTEAIGGEMEGRGLVASCANNGAEWILIKAISDWGYNKQNINKKLNQTKAIKNVLRFLFFTFENFQF